MIGTLLRFGWINLRRDRVAQALTFLLPIVFFSIFANVFGRQGDDSTASVRIAVVDEDRSEVSQRIVAGLRQEKSLRVRTTADEKGAGAALDRAAAERLVKGGDVPVAVVLPAGFGAAVAESGFMAQGTSIQLLADVSDPIAPQMVEAPPPSAARSGRHVGERLDGRALRHEPALASATPTAAPPPPARHHP